MAADDGLNSPAQVVVLRLARWAAPFDQWRKPPLPVRQNPVLGSISHPFDMG
jgi:hypothetical protein